MKKAVILALILTILAAAIFLLFINFSQNITGAVIEEQTHSWTKAICDENNYCEDYEITCNKNISTKITPTGYGIQHEENWEDPRDQEMIEKLC